LSAFALSEPASGSDVANMAMTATRDGDDYVLNGEKTWISNGGIADVYTSLPAPAKRRGAKGLSVFIVPADTPGLEIAERLDVVAPHPLARLALQRLPHSGIGDDRRLAHGFRIAMSVLDVFRSTVAAAALGFARRALDESLSRVGARTVRRADERSADGAGAYRRHGA
jgi:acyl-CoA dehydrogenase